MRALAAITLVLFTCLAAAGVKQEIRFKRGESSATLSGGVIRGDRDYYTLEARKGQTLQLEISSPEKNAVYEVYAPGYTLPAEGYVMGVLLPGANEATRTRVELPVSGKYLVVVGGTRGNAEYKLSVVITEPPGEDKR